VLLLALPGLASRGCKRWRSLERKRAPWVGTRKRQTWLHQIARTLYSTVVPRHYQSHWRSKRSLAVSREMNWG
jgi:hypothetical protein